MRVIIDSDTIAFACAATAENQDTSHIAISRANQSIENILLATEADSYELWLTGPNNFRYQLFPEYKANRHGAYRPKWEREVKQWMVDEWDAEFSEGCEADDMCGVRQQDDTTIIAHIDKDINLIPGWHYNWELTREGKIIREARKYYVTPEEAHYNFCYQLLIGDSADGIKGVPGIGPKKAAALLDATEPDQWISDIRDLYSCDEELELNAGCLWLWRKPNDIWRLDTHGISNCKENS